MKKSEGLKHDQDKLRWDLLPSEAIEDVIEIMMFGATKYGDYNWTNGINYNRIFSACMRHMWAWWRSEDLDSESGKNHLAHAMCCIMFLLSYIKRNQDFQKTFDNRPTYLKEK